jgi:methylthioribose-1-phosphate isomerase
MQVNGKHYRTIWIDEKEPSIINIIDQRALPHRFEIERLQTFNDMVIAIKEMKVRGAGLIGASAAYGMYLALLETDDESTDEHLLEYAKKLIATRPTAVNLSWAVNRQMENISKAPTRNEKINVSRKIAEEIADEDADYCRSIGKQGMKIIQQISEKKNGEVVNILTHCNAGWLAFVDRGSATAPIYEAFEKGIPVHVWVDETRPRNQGASLTAWELVNQGIPHTVISDNTGGHLMQKGMVDMVITGADRVTRSGDAANKIGTYLKALAAKDNQVPFYVAFPSSTFDWNISDGLSEIEIEERSADEVRYISGLCDDTIKQVLITPEKSPAMNYGFDVTPARLITALITERGICSANEKEIIKLFPERIKK